MRAASGLLLLGLLLGSCDDKSRAPPLRAYNHALDQARAATGSLIGSPCYRRMAEEEKLDEFIGLEKCYVLTASRRYRGVWLTEFEASKFLPNERTAPGIWRWTPEDIDLSVGQTKNILFVETLAAPPRRAYHIEFIGRQIAYPRTNSFGEPENTILVDQITSIRQLTAPTQTELCTPKCVPFNGTD